jgi:hypothetical protein
MHSFLHTSQLALSLTSMSPPAAKA